ncbi:hypothetical protein H0H92_008750, partial [Tricholoma furcatifolium]
MSTPPWHLGDIAWVHSVNKHHIATVLYLPRVDRSRSYDQTQNKGRSRRRKRPQQALLSIAEAVRLFGNANVERLLDEPLENNCFMFKTSKRSNSTLITYGFVSKETHDFDIATPSDTELGQFFSQDLFRQLQSDSTSQLALKNMAALRLQPGDPVRICTGELTGMTGVVHGLELHDVALVVVDGALSAGEVAIPKVDLRALYKVGDRVKVIYGKHRGEMGFIVGIDDEFLALHDHSKTIDNPANEVQFVVPADSVQFYAEALVITRAGPPAIQKIPFGKTAENDYVGRLVQVIRKEKFKMYEGRIIKLCDSDNTKVEVQLSAKLAHAKGELVVIPLSHLCDRNDPTKKPLLDDTPQKTTSRLDQDMMNHEPMAPPAPRSSVHRPLEATPLWSPTSGGSSSTPAWDPSSRTPGSSSTGRDPPSHTLESRLPRPDSFLKNPYITSLALSDDLRIEVVINNSSQHPRWEGGRLEGSLGIWRKGDNRNPGIAKVSISGREYLVPERYIRPNNPTGKGPVIVVDQEHQDYCG